MADLTELHRLAGNEAVNRVAQGRGAAIQLTKANSSAAHPVSELRSSVTTRTPWLRRDIVDDRDRSQIVLDRFNRDGERAQVITACLYEKLWRSDALGEARFDEIYDRVKAGVDAASTDIDDQSRIVGLSELVEKHFGKQLEKHFALQEKRHQNWLVSGGGSKLAPHEALLAEQAQELFAHYNFFDKNMVWRFTSTPSTELVYVAPGTSHEEVAKVVAAHSGGADKSNPNVITLSFGRNLGALMGVAASTGGDKKVLNISDKAEYIFGIDIGTLAKHGISAHPATARMISVFETEYVLVGTPGDRARSLTELATVKYANPFKLSAIAELAGASTDKSLMTEATKKKDQQGSKQKSQQELAEESMKPVVPESVSDLQKMDLQRSKEILQYARKVKQAANNQSGTVRDTEGATQHLIDSSMKEFQSDLR